MNIVNGGLIMDTLSVRGVERSVKEVFGTKRIKYDREH